MNLATIHSIDTELARAREKWPNGATLPALMKSCGDLAAALLMEGRAEAGSASHVASTKARWEAIQVVVILVRMIEGI